MVEKEKKITMCPAVDEKTEPKRTKCNLVACTPKLYRNVYEMIWNKRIFVNTKKCFRNVRHLPSPKIRVANARRHAVETHVFIYVQNKSEKAK